MKTLTEHEKTICSDLMKGMPENERETAIRAIPMAELCDEVERRRNLAFTTLDRVAEIVLTITEESTYKDVVTAIRLINTLTNLGDI